MLSSKKIPEDVSPFGIDREVGLPSVGNDEEFASSKVSFAMAFEIPANVKVSEDLLAFCFFMKITHLEHRPTYDKQA